MRVFNIQVFDTVITGTSTTWYSRSEFDGHLAQADGLVIHACVSNVGGTTPTLTIVSEHSPDSENWIATGASEINNVAIANNASFSAGNFGFTSANLGAYVRYRITLGGTNPQCRLKLFVTGRDHAA